MKTILSTAIAIAVILLLAGGAVWYVVRQKKKGRKCIGCNCGSCSSCHK